MPPELEHSHHPSDIQNRLAGDYEVSYLRDSILGGIDGCVTTIAVVASVAGAGLPGVVAFVLGIASLVADALSMGVSNYQAVKSDDDARERLRNQEKRHIENEPEGEREEIRQIFRMKGLEGQVLEQVVDTITSDHRLWVDTMIQEEFGHSLQGPSPWRAGVTTFLMFLAVGAVPLVPFLMPFFAGTEYFIASFAFAALALFAIGWAKGVILQMNRWRAGLETLLMGGSASAVAFLFGYFLEPMLADLNNSF